MLNAGDTMPDLELEDRIGQPVRLADHRGQNNVLLYFMRSTTCPVCNRHVKDLTSRQSFFDAHGVRVLVVVPEGRDEAATWQAKRNVPYPVVTGRRGTPHESIGLTRQMFGSMQQSGTVLLNRAGAIVHAHGATMPVLSYDRKGVETAVRQLS